MATGEDAAEPCRGARRKKKMKSKIGDPPFASVMSRTAHFFAPSSSLPTNRCLVVGSVAGVAVAAGFAVVAAEAAEASSETSSRDLLIKSLVRVASSLLPAAELTGAEMGVFLHPCENGDSL